MYCQVSPGKIINCLHFERIIIQFDDADLVPMLEEIASSVAGKNSVELTERFSQHLSCSLQTVDLGRVLAWARPCSHNDSLLLLQLNMIIIYRFNDTFILTRRETFCKLSSLIPFTIKMKINFWNFHFGSDDCKGQSPFGL